MTQEQPHLRPSGPRYAAAAVLGLIVPFVVPLAVLVSAANARRDMRAGRRVPEPPFLYRFAMGLSAGALVVQALALVLVLGVWRSYTERLEQTGAVGVVGDPCVVADACCEAIHGSGAARCRPLAEGAGEIQSMPESGASATERAYCVEALRALRSELVAAERPLPDACGWVEAARAK